MNALRSVFRELMGLFVDDSSLALKVIAVVALAAISTILIPGIRMATGAILLIGSFGVILQSAVERRS